MLKFNLLFEKPSKIYVENTGLLKAASSCFSPLPVVLTVESFALQCSWLDQIRPSKKKNSIFNCVLFEKLVFNIIQLHYIN